MAGRRHSALLEGGDSYPPLEAGRKEGERKEEGEGSNSTSHALLRGRRLAVGAGREGGLEKAGTSRHLLLMPHTTSIP